MYKSGSEEGLGHQGAHRGIPTMRLSGSDRLDMCTAPSSVAEPSRTAPNPDEFCRAKDSIACIIILRPPLPPSTHSPRLHCSPPTLALAKCRRSYSSPVKAYTPRMGPRSNLPSQSSLKPTTFAARRAGPMPAACTWSW